MEPNFQSRLEFSILNFNLLAFLRSRIFIPLVLFFFSYTCIYIYIYSKLRTIYTRSISILHPGSKLTIVKVCKRVGNLHKGWNLRNLAWFASSSYVRKFRKPSRGLLSLSLSLVFHPYPANSISKFDQILSPPHSSSPIRSPSVSSNPLRSNSSSSSDMSPSLLGSNPRWDSRVQGGE